MIALCKMPAGTNSANDGRQVSNSVIKSASWILAVANSEERYFWYDIHVAEQWRFFNRVEMTILAVALQCPDSTRVSGLFISLCYLFHDEGELCVVVCRDRSWQFAHGGIVPSLQSCR